MSNSLNLENKLVLFNRELLS